MPREKYNKVFVENGVLFKKCCDCSIIKPVSEFGRRRKLWTYHCKECKKIADKKKAVERKSLGRCHPTYQEHSKKERDRTLRRRYGISLSEYNDLLKSQGGVCAICGLPETFVYGDGVKGILSVDHNHKNGRRRQLLCRSCNHGIGNFKDDIGLLQKAIAYLTLHEQHER